MPIWNRLICCMLALLWMTSLANAQEMRIYTTIREKSAVSRLPDQRSLMMFHAGKVYDYIEPAQEVTVFEPAHRRFTVLNLRRQLRTEITQDEIRQFLRLAEDEAQKRLAQLDAEDPLGRKSRELVQFQLQPNFDVTFDASKSQISLANPAFQYVAVGFAPPSLDLTEKYLHVADWMAQFNSVLHPHSLLPAPRLQLNEQLRSRGLIPSTVELDAVNDLPIHLQAHHEWTWNLQRTDRQMIDDWEKQLQSPKFRTVTFRQFQQDMLKR